MRKSTIYKYSKEELQNLLDTNSCYTEILKIMNIKGGSSTNTLKRIIKEYDLDTTKFENNHKEYIHKQASTICNTEYKIEEKLTRNSNANSHKLKNKLIESGIKERKCESCGLSEWLGKEIKLHLHHKDGNHSNNELSNLELLCPNCHSYTDNYGVYNSFVYKENQNK